MLLKINRKVSFYDDNFLVFLFLTCFAVALNDTGPSGKAIALEREVWSSNPRPVRLKTSQRLYPVVIIIRKKLCS